MDDKNIEIVLEKEVIENLNKLLEKKISVTELQREISYYLSYNLNRINTNKFNGEFEITYFSNLMLWCKKDGDTIIIQDVVLFN